MKFFIAAFFLMLLISCKKTGVYYDNYGAAKKLSLPAYSENGKGTFGFLMDDSVFTVFGAFHSATMFGSSWITNAAETGFNHDALTGKQIIQITGRLSVVRQNAIEKDFTAGFNIALDAVSPVKTYFLPASVNSTYPGIFSLQKDYINWQVAGIYYAAMSNRPFTLEITKFDTLAKICSGRFSGILYDYFGTPDSIIVTNGRFDVKYQ